MFKKTWSSHVGVIVVAEGRVMLFESTSIRGGVKGVRLVPVSEAIPFYDGDVMVRKLKTNRDVYFTSTINRFVTSTINKKYESSVFELMGSAWNGWFIGHNRPDYTTYFCSELVAHLYQRLMLIPDDVITNEMTPEDFRLGGKVDKLMAKMPEASCLGVEITITNANDQKGGVVRT